MSLPPSPCDALSNSSVSFPSPLRRSAEEALREDASQFRSLADSAPVLIWSATAEADFQYCNRAWLEFSGRALAQELGQGWAEHVHAEDREYLIAAFKEASKRQRRFEKEYRMRRHDGEFRWMLSVGVPRVKPDGTLVDYVGTCVDTTDRKCEQMEMEQLLTARCEAHAQLAEQTEKLHHLAESDPLTGALNRRSFREQFEREWSRSRRNRRPLSCIMLDIDYFKKINDTHGHAAGDAILQAVAALLTEHCRPSDLVCRYGGEEFCVMVPETSEEGAAAVAERLRTALAESRTDVGGKLLSITSSFGVAQCLGEEDSVTQLIERADQALLVAKQSGRNRVFSSASESKLAEQTNQASPATVLQAVTAKDVMSSTPCIPCDHTVAEAVALLLGRDLPLSPVVDRDGKLLGFVSEQELIGLSVSKEAWSQPVQKIMKTNVVSYDAATPCAQILQFFSRAAVPRIVVVENGKPIGLIGPRDLLKYFERRAAQGIG